MHSITFLYTETKAVSGMDQWGFLKSHVCEEGLFLISLRPPVVNRVGRDGGGGGGINLSQAPPVTVGRGGGGKSIVDSLPYCLTCPTLPYIYICCGLQLHIASQYYKSLNSL